MKRSERAALKAAGEIITRELAAGREVRIPGFGRFRTSETQVYEGQHPMDEDGWHTSMLKTIKLVRFRPWERLKRALNPESWARRDERKRRWAERTRRPAPNITLT